MSGARPGQGVRGLAVLAAALLLVGWCLAAIQDAASDGSPSRGLWFAVGGAGIALILACKRRLKLDSLSATVVYMAIFWIFHFGLIFSASILPDLLDELPSWARDWLFVREAASAALHSLLFLACFAVGILWTSSLLSPDSGNAPAEVRSELVLAGWIVVAVGLLLFIASAARAGLGIFLASYEEYFALSNPFAGSVALVSYGLILQAAGGRRVGSVLVASLCCFVPIAGLSLLAGGRGPSLFSAAILLVALMRRGLRVPRLALVLGAIGLMVVTSAIRETRQYGAARLEESGGIAAVQGPLAGLIELGGTLRPVQATIDFTQTEGFFHGETYLYPFTRQLDRFLGNDRGTPWTDRRFIADWINWEYGSIGYSTVAEAYANGGTVGVVLFAFLWGVVFRVLDHKSGTAYGLAAMSAVLIPMTVNIRNSFIFVPGWIFLGLVPILAAAASMGARRRVAEIPQRASEARP